LLYYENGEASTFAPCIIFFAVISIVSNFLIFDAVLNTVYEFGYCIDERLLFTCTLLKKTRAINKLEALYFAVFSRKILQGHIRAYTVSATLLGIYNLWKFFFIQRRLLFISHRRYRRRLRWQFWDLIKKKHQSKT
jgi:hypothetical protein